MVLSLHQPERTCVGCFHKFPQKDLVGISRLKDGTVVVDFDHKFSGRSVYLCRKKHCFLKAYRRKGKNALEYGLKVSIPQQVWIELEAFFDKDDAKLNSRQ